MGQGVIDSKSAFKKEEEKTVPKESVVEKVVIHKNEPMQKALVVNTRKTHVEVQCIMKDNRKVTYEEVTHPKVNLGSQQSPVTPENIPLPPSPKYLRSVPLLLS